jgi:hypothetical protein
LLVAVVLIIAAVMAGWTALAHRGAVRALAAAVAVAALLGLGVLLVVGSPLRLAVLVGLRSPRRAHGRPSGPTLPRRSASACRRPG